MTSVDKKHEMSVMDVARGEMVEAELDRLIERSSCQKDPNEDSELWRQSVRAYEEKRRQMARLALELSGRYARDFDLADLIKKLTLPPPAIESDLPAGNITTVIGVQTIAGVPRGTVEQVLANLCAEAKPTPSRRRRFMCTTFFRIPRLCNRTLT